MEFSIFTFYKKRELVIFIRIHMLGRLKLLLLSALFVSTYAFSQSGLGTLRGTVTDEVTKAPLEFSKVLLKQAGAIRGSALTDERVNSKLVVFNQVHMMLK